MESPDSFPLDLNYDQLSEHMIGAHPLVTNFGTTKHVANQLNAFKIVHYLAAHHGIMIHELPICRQLAPERISHFWLFDSFEGFSPDYSSVDDFSESPGFLDLATGFYRQAGLYEYVRDRFASFRSATFVNGFLPQTLDAAAPSRIGFLHIDLNAPRAEIAVLSNDCSTACCWAGSSCSTITQGRCFTKKEAEDDFMR
jgi:hypothetical protein